jgi:hypothetical protein
MIYITQEKDLIVSTSPDKGTWVYFKLSRMAAGAESTSTRVDTRVHYQ